MDREGCKAQNSAELLLSSKYLSLALLRASPNELSGFTVPVRFVFFTGPGGAFSYSMTERARYIVTLRDRIPPT